MQASAYICHHSMRRAAKAGIAAFGRIVALGWYDGPTEGVAQCAACAAVYRFRMLDEDLDRADDQDLRIFDLAPLPGNALDEIVAACSMMDTPRWPVWAPLWRFESNAQRQRVEEKVNEILAAAAAPQFVAASDNGLRTIRACKPLAPGDYSTVTDWFAFLGLTRRGRGERA